MIPPDDDGPSFAAYERLLVGRLRSLAREGLPPKPCSPPKGAGASTAREQKEGPIFLPRISASIPVRSARHSGVEGLRAWLVPPNGSRALRGTCARVGTRFSASPSVAFSLRGGP